MPTANGSLTANDLWPYLERCGYASDNVLRNVRLPGDRTATFAGFAQRPFDTRSACFSALDAVTTPDEDAKACRDLGAPITFLCHGNHVLWFGQTPDRGPYQIGMPISAAQLDGFFQAHAEDFKPRTIYRAKTVGRFEQTCQRAFVDLGLMPLLEKEAGQAIERLLLDSVAEARDMLG